MCLCGLLGAETDGLPEKVKAQTQRFFEQNIEWLTQAYQQADGASEQAANAQAIATLSLLEGAMLVSKAMNDTAIFATASAGLLATR